MGFSFADAMKMFDTVSGNAMPFDLGENMFSSGSDTLAGGSGTDTLAVNNPVLQRAVQQTESANKSDAVSPKGAWGLMQLMPETAAKPGYGVAPFDTSAPDWDKENVRLGTDYLNAMRAKFGNDTDALVAYNAGPGRAEKWIAEGRDLAKLPKETRDYIAKVNNNLAGSGVQQDVGVIPAATRSVKTTTILPPMPNTTDVAKTTPSGVYPNTTTIAKNVPPPEAQPTEIAAADPATWNPQITLGLEEPKPQAAKADTSMPTITHRNYTPSVTGAGGAPALEGQAKSDAFQRSGMSFADARALASQPAQARQMETVVEKGSAPVNEMVSPLDYEVAGPQYPKPANDITQPFTIPQAAINMLPGGNMWGPIARAAGLTTVSADTAQTAKDMLEGGILPGVSANFGDELGAGAAAPIVYGADLYRGDPNASLGGAYDKVLASSRAGIKEAQQRSPTATTLGEIGGAVGGVALAAPEMGAAGLGGLIGRGFLEGGIYGGVSGAGSGEGGYDRLKQAAVGAGTGAVLGAALPAAGGLVAKTTAPLRAVYRGLRNPSGEAANFVRSAISENKAPLTGMEFAEGVGRGQPLTNVERGGVGTRELARSAANLNSNAKGLLDEAVNARADTSGDRISMFIDNIVGGANATAEKDALKAQAAAILKPRYDRARAQGDTPMALARLQVSPEMQRLQTSPDIKAAMSAAEKNAEGRAVAEGGQAPTTRNLQYWDYVKRELDDSIGEAQRKGLNNRADVLIKQKNALVNELDRIVPSYSAARSKAAEFFDAKDALEAGQNFISKRVSFQEASKVIRGMSNPERVLFRKGFADSLLRTIEQAPDRANIVRKIFGSHDARLRMKLALGTDAYEKVAAHLKVEQAMGLLKNAVQGNSTTAQQLLSSRLLNYGAAPTGGLLYDETVGGGLMDPVGLVLAGGLAGGGHVATRKVTTQIAKMLLADDPKLYAKGVTFLAKNKNFMRNLHTLTTSLTASGAQAAIRGRQQAKDQSRVGITP